MCGELENLEREHWQTLKRLIEIEKQIARLVEVTKKKEVDYDV
jgi:hypothetical protein